MRKHVCFIVAAAIAVTAASATVSVRAAGQAAAAAKPAAIKRLPDGTPDIRGTWVRVGGGLNEANAPESQQRRISYELVNFCVRTRE